jgi:hypothetical protein
MLWLVDKTRSGLAVDDGDLEDGDFGDEDNESEPLIGRLCSIDFFLSDFLDRSPSSRLETLFNPTRRSRRRTSRMTWERIALRALVSLMRFEAKSSS